MSVGNKVGALAAPWDGFLLVWAKIAEVEACGVQPLIPEKGVSE
jgi:hypothetical protein